MRIDSHHSFSERQPLEYLGTILKRNRFEGSVLVADAPGAPEWVFPEFVHGVVVRADLRDPQFPYLLDGYQRDPRFRGVCYHFKGGLPDGLAELERRGIPLDAVGVLSLIPSIVERFPSLRIVIDHLGAGNLPADYWARDLAQAAQSPQVFCKLSGVARVPRTYVRHALAVFGSSRLMFGSDWPDCLPDTTWKASLAAFTQAIGAQTFEVREELLGGTAERFYGL